MPVVSSFGAQLATAGFEIAIGTAASPPVYTVVANCSDMTLPAKSDTVDVTNFGDSYHRRAATLLDLGKITCKIFWRPEEPTHDATTGLRGLWINRTLAPVEFIYPDGATDAFNAYVTGFSVTGKVGGVFEATVEFSNSGPVTLA
jgi:hypothetical protein